MSKIIDGIAKDLKAIPETLKAKTAGVDKKKLILMNLPYILAGYFCDKIAWLWRVSPGSNASDKMMAAMNGLNDLFSNPLPSFFPKDLLIGIAGGVALRLVVYFKAKNAKKFRQGVEYGSARWGNAKDIEPYVDPVFENNVILTETERLMMSGRPKQPKYARNKNILVIGGSGSGKSEEDKNQWIIDEEAAEVVRRIYRMSLEGKGPYEIARILSEEQIERPSYYLAKRGLGTCRSNNNTATPYVWRGATVRDILSKPEYMGHTVNFRSYKESYKDKRAKKTPKEDWVIFKNTQEAIVSEEMWNKVQELRKTVRRTDTVGEANPFTGLLYCADCGAKMYNHRGGAGRARNWKGELNGKRRPDRDEYNCSTYNLSRQSYDKQCSQHYIRTEVVRKLVLETIKAVSDYVITNEEEFINRIYSTSRDKQKESIRSLKRKIAQDTKRVNELNMLMKKLYEDNISGKLSDKRFEFMLSEFENEQDTLEISMENAKAEIEKYESDTVRADKFIELVKRYTDFSELTTPMLNEFVEKILVHEADYSSGERVQEVEIYLNFIGKFKLPVKEPTAEEIAEHENLKARRAKKAEYNRRYMEKRRKRIEEEEQKSKEVTVNG